MRDWFADLGNCWCLTPPVIPWLSHRPTSPVGRMSCREEYELQVPRMVPTGKLPIGCRRDVRWHGHKHRE